MTGNTIPATATCPVCEREAAWVEYNKRYEAATKLLVDFITETTGGDRRVELLRALETVGMG